MVDRWSILNRSNLSEGSYGFSNLFVIGRSNKWHTLGWFNVVVRGSGVTMEVVANTLEWTNLSSDPRGLSKGH